jgi:hypothetical protein
MSELLDQRIESLRGDISTRNHAFYQAEAEKLTSWAEDLKGGLEREIKDLDASIRDVRRESLAAESLDAKLEAQRSLRALERQRAAKRKDLFESQDRVDSQRDDLISRVEAKLVQHIDVQQLFTIRWVLT